MGEETLSCRFLRGYQVEEGADVAHGNPRGGTKSEGDSGSGYEVDGFWVT